MGTTARMSDCLVEKVYQHIMDNLKQQKNTHRSDLVKVYQESIKEDDRQEHPSAKQVIADAHEKMSREHGYKAKQFSDVIVYVATSSPNKKI